MHNDKVCHFPVGKWASHRVVGMLNAEPKQLDLFEHAYGTLRAVSYLDIAVLEQEQLIRSLVKNAVTTIIDLRGVPVFPKPRFDHRYLMSYFYERSMNYIELAMVTKASSDRLCEGENLNRWLTSSMPCGITACIVDDAAIREGVVSSFRKNMTKAGEAFVELHPRAIIY